MKKLLFRQWLQAFARQCFGWLFPGPRTPYRKRADVERLLRHVPALQLLEKRQAPTAVRGTDLLAAAFAPAPNAPPAQSSILPPGVLDRVDDANHGGDDPGAWSSPSGTSIGELLHQVALRQAGLDAPARNHAPAENSDPPRFSVGLNGSRALSFNYFNALVSADELLSDPLDDGGSAPRSRLPAGSAAPSASAAGGSSGLSPLNLGATVSGYTPQRLGGTNQQIPVAQPNNSGTPGSSTANSSTSPTAATGTVATQTTLQALQDPLGAGSWVILTATVAAKDSSGTPPTGTVSFYSGKVLLGEAPLTDGPNGDQASFFIDSTRPGMESFTASYSGDQTYAASSGHLQLPPQSSFSTVPALQTPGLSGTSTPGSGVSTPSVGSLGGGVTTPSGGASSGSSSSDPGDSVTSSTSDDSSGSSSPSLRFSPLLSPAPVGTSTSLTATPAAVTVGQGGVTLTATVFTSGAAALPVYQTVSFYADGSYLGWVYLTEVVAGQYVATDVDSSLNAGSHAYSANYSGSGTGYLGSTAAASDVVASVSTANSLSATPATVTVGQAVTLTATVLSAGATALPAGYVSFYADGSYVGQTALTEVVGGTYVATLADSSLNAGSYTFSDSYAGSGTNFLASSATAAATVDPVSTTNSLSVTPGTVTVGQALTLTATVQSSAAAALASEYVSFYANGSSVGLAYLYQITGGTYEATLAVGLNAGSYTFSESYSAGSNYLESSATASAVVQPVSTANSLTATPGTVTVGQDVTLTATVQSSGPAALAPEYVSFYANGSYVGLGYLYDVAGETYEATLAVGLNAGSYTFSESYSAGSNYLESSATASAVVQPVSTANSLTATPGTVTVGQDVTLTATVQSSAAAALASEYVSFYANGSYVGAAYLNEVTGGTYVATLAVALNAGSYTFSESYSAGSDYLESSATASAVVQPVSTTNSLSVSPGTVTVGQDVTLTATVQSSGPAALPPEYVSFYANGSYVGAAYLYDVAGETYEATLAVGLNAGSYTFSEGYVGSSNFLESSATASGTVAAATTSAALTASPNPITAGQAVTLTALVVDSDDSVLPNDVVSFYVDGSYAGVGELAEAAGGDYEATLVEYGLAAGSHSFLVTYAGSGSNYLGSSATASAVTLPASPGSVTTSTTLSATPSPLSLGEAVTLTATVYVSGGNSLPAGSAEAFYQGYAPLGSTALAEVAPGEYQAVLVAIPSGAGSQTFTASYSAPYPYGSEYGGSSGSATDFVNSISTSSSLSASPSPLSLGEAVTLTATVYVSGGDTLLGGATEAFYDGYLPLGSAALIQVAAGEYQAVLVTIPSGVGSQSFTASYTAPYGYGSEYGGSSATATDFVNSISTSSSLSASPSPLSLGEAVTLTATVYVSGGTTLPGGATETFYEGYAELGTTALTEVAPGEYQAVLVAIPSGVGSQTFTASYSAPYGYGSEYGGSSATAADFVNSISTSSSLSASPSPLSLGEAVTLTATVYVSGGTTLPGGATETFYEGYAELGTTALTEVAPGEYQAVLVAIPSGVGSQTFTASYSAPYGYGSEYGGSSATAADFVNSISTSSSLSASPSPLSLGEAATLTATVYVSGGTTLPGASTETFYDGYAELGTAALSSVAAGEYQADFVVNGLSAGSQSFTATYAAPYPDGSEYGGSSAETTDFVHSISTSSSLSATPDPVTLGEAVTLTATVYTSGGNTLPGDSFESFYVNGSYLGSTVLTLITPGEYQAVFVDNVPSPGSLTFTATYAGSGSNYSGSSAEATDYAVYGISSTLTVTPDPTTYDSSATLTATLLPSTTLSLSGTESFYFDGDLLGTAAITSTGSQYQAILVTGALPGGDDLVSGVFAGNATYGSTTATFVETVDPAATSTDLTASPNPVTAAEAVTLTASVSGPGTVFGEVEFLAGDDVLGSATVNDTGTATLIVSDLPAGTDALTAVYEGNTDYLSSTSSPVSQVVDALPGSGTVIVAAQDTTYTGTLATFSSASGSIDDYSATILWGDGQSSTGTVVSDGSGSYSVVGSHAYAQQGAYAVAVEIDFDGSTAGVAADAAFVLDPASDSQLDTVLSATVTGSGSLATTLGLGSGDYTLSGTGTASFGMTEVVATPDGTLTLTETGSLGFSLSESGATGGFTMTAYSLGDSGTDVASINQGINDLTDDVTETETITDGFTLVKTGDDATGGFTQTGTDTATTVMATGGTDGDGGFTLNQTTTATTTTYEGGNYLSGSFNLTAFQSATASFTESGNDGPITYTQTGSTSSGSTMFETGDLNTGGFHVSNYTWDSYTQSETGDDVAGDDGLTTTGGDTDTQTITGNNQTGAYTLTDTSTSTSTAVMSGNDESDDYSITEIDSSSQTVTETASETSAAYTMTVTSADSASDTGGDVDAEMTDGYSATDSDNASSTEIGNYLTGSVTMTGLTTLSDSDNDTADDQGDDVTDGDSDTDVDHWTASGNTNTNSGSWSETDANSIIAESAHSTMFDGPETISVSTTATGSLHDSEGGDDETGSDVESDTGTSSGTTYLSIYNQGLSNFVTTFFSDKNSGSDAGDTLTGADTTGDSSTSSTTSISNLYLGMLTEWTTTHSKNTETDADSDNTDTGGASESSSGTDSGNVSQTVQDQGYSDFISTLFSGSLNLTDVGNTLTGSNALGGFGNSSTTSTSHVSDGPTSQSIVSTSSNSESDSDNGNDLSGSDTDTAGDSDSGTVVETTWDQGVVDYASTFFSSNLEVTDDGNTLTGNEAGTNTGSSSTSTFSTITEGSLTETATSSSSDQQSGSESDNDYSGADSDSETDSGSGSVTQSIYDQGATQFVTTNFSSSTTTGGHGSFLYGSDTGTNAVSSSTSSVSNLTEGSLSESATSSSTSHESGTDSDNDVSGSDSEADSGTSTGSSIQYVFDQGMTNYASTFFSGDVTFNDQGNTVSGTDTVTNTSTSSTSTVQDLNYGSLTEWLTSSGTNQDKDTDNDNAFSGSDGDSGTDTTSTSSNETIVDDGSTVSFSTSASDTDHDSDVDNDLSGSVSEGDNDSGNSTQVETTNNDGLTTTTTVIGSDSATATTTGNEVTDDVTEAETGSGSDTQTESGSDARGTFTLSDTATTTTSSNQSEDGPDGGYSTSTSTTTVSVIHQSGGDGTTTYSDSITGTQTNSQHDSGDSDTGAFTLTTSAGGTTTTQESGTYAPADSSYSLTLTSSTSSYQVQIGNTGTGAYTQTGTQSIDTTLNEDGWDSAGSYDLTKTSFFSASSYQTGNSSTGAYSLTETDGAGYTASESATAGSYATTYTETTSTNSTKSEIGNSSGDYTRTVVGTSTANDTDFGTDAAGTFSVSETQSGNFSQQQTGNNASGDYSLTGTATNSYSVYESGTGSAGTFTLQETGTETPTTSETGNTVTGTSTEAQTGTDSYTMVETGMLGSTPFSQSITGSDTFSQGDVANTQSGEYSITETGTGSATVSETQNGTALPVETPAYGYSLTDSGNTTSGNFSLTETGSDRYSLLETFNNVANSTNGTPGNMDYSPEGRPFTDAAADTPSDAAKAEIDARKKALQDWNKLSAEKQIKFLRGLNPTTPKDVTPKLIVTAYLTPKTKDGKIVAYTLTLIATDPKKRAVKVNGILISGVSVDATQTDSQKANNIYEVKIDSVVLSKIGPQIGIGNIADLPKDNGIPVVMKAIVGGKQEWGYARPVAPTPIAPK